MRYYVQSNDGDPTDPIIVMGVCWCPSCNGSVIAIIYGFLFL